MSPDSGKKVVTDRFGAITPRVLFSTASYFYNGKTHSTEDLLRHVSTHVPSFTHIFLVPYLPVVPASFGSVEKLSPVTEFMNSAKPPRVFEFCQVPVDHPIYILFTSGTTGPPKCIVQSYGLYHFNNCRIDVLHCRCYYQPLEGDFNTYRHQANRHSLHLHQYRYSHIPHVVHIFKKILTTKIK